MASEIEEFREQLIKKNPDTSKNNLQKVADDLIIAFDALDWINDNLGELMDETEHKDYLCILAQMRSELYVYFNGLTDTIQNLGEGIEPHQSPHSFNYC